ncbi:MAG TPA: hypothetical protein VG738_03480 [Chitinophagaceae bacterium]|nr:hypothetical protein [Chitinophagaceae bacterium]
MQLPFLVCIAILLPACAQHSASYTPHLAFLKPVRITIKGYSGNCMEPFITRDGSTLLFNNLNAAPENTNLHWATRINDSTFEYKGEITGVNTDSLEGVPSMDSLGNLYFISNRSYSNTLSTIYHCNFSNGAATSISLVKGVSKQKPWWVDFDVEISTDGQTLYFTDGRFNNSNNPETADLVIAEKDGTGFKRLANSDAIMENINTGGLEYGACISADQLTLYFTRVPLPLTQTSAPEIMVATRNSKDEPFSIPSKIESITGFAEAPTIAPSQQIVYYHKKEDGRFVLYMVRKE